MFESEYLIYSILFGAIGILYFIMHKFWKSYRDKNPIFPKIETNTKSIENWIIIIFLAIISLGFLIKSII